MSATATRTVTELPKLTKTHLSRVLSTDDGLSKSPYSLRNDAFLGWREPPRSTGMTGSTIGGHRISNTSDNEREVLQARKRQNENLRRRWRPSALNPSHSRVTANDVNATRFPGSGADRTGGTNKRTYDQYRPDNRDSGARPYNQPRGLQTTSIHRPDNRIQKSDPYYKAGPRRGFVRDRTISRGTYHGDLSRGDSWAPRRIHSIHSSNPSANRRFSGLSDNGHRGKRRYTHSGTTRSLKDEYELEEGELPPYYYSETPIPDAEVNKGIRFDGFPYKEIKGDWPKAIRYFFRDGGGASSVSNLNYLSCDPQLGAQLLRHNRNVGKLKVFSSRKFT